MGFERRGKNIGLLKRYKGNVAEVVEHYQTKHNKCEKELQTLDPETEEKLKQLEALGYTRRWKALRFLTKFHGDVEKVAAYLKDHKCHKQPVDAATEEKLKQLEALGLTKRHRNLKLLQKFNGNVE